MVHIGRSIGATFLLVVLGCAVGAKGPTPETSVEARDASANVVLAAKSVGAVDAGVDVAIVDAKVAVPSYATPALACTALAVDGATCRVVSVTTLRGDVGVARLEVSSGGQSHSTLSLRSEGDWRISSCDLMRVFGSTHGVAATVKQTDVVEVHDRMLVVLRFVAHEVWLEPFGVGPNGRGDGPLRREYGDYVDHLVVVDVADLACDDHAVFKMAGPERLVPPFTKPLPVPKGWRDDQLVRVDDEGNVTLETLH